MSESFPGLVLLTIFSVLGGLHFLLFDALCTFNFTKFADLLSEEKWPSVCYRANIFNNTYTLKPLHGKTSLIIF